MSGNADWNTNAGMAFGKAEPNDEYFHGWGPAGDSLTETWYWGFNVPDAAINCFVYCWVHPNLDVVTCGLNIYKGVKQQHLECELWDFFAYLKAGPVIGDGSVIQPPNGLRVEVIEPLKHMRLSFCDDARQTSCRIDMKAVAAPIMRANNLHFEQVMHCTGELILRGERHSVDSFTVRDRSWGELRPENNNPAPPYNWVTGVLDNGGFAFNVGSHDDPALGPDWADIMPVDAKRVLKDGWVARGDRQTRIVRASKITRRDHRTLRPEQINIEFEEEDGQIHCVKGDVIASTPGFHWPNIATHLALVRWELNGAIGYGESQDVHWNDYVYKSSLQR